LGYTAAQGIPADGEIIKAFFTRAFSFNPSDAYSILDLAVGSGLIDDMTHPALSSTNFNYRMSGMRAGANSREGNSVAGLFLIWTALFLLFMSKNVSGSNPSYGDDEKVTGPLDVFRDYSDYSSSSNENVNTKKFTDSSSSGNSSFLLGTFFMGFGIASLLAAFLLGTNAPSRLRALRAFHFVAQTALAQLKSK